MARKAADPTEAMRERASHYPDVDEGTACTQSSFKANNKAFLFVGMQGGRHKAMFKLQASMPEARKLAAAEPDLFQAQKGESGWVTARFTAEKPMPTRLWKKWLDESYALSAAGPGKKSSRKKTAKKKTAKKRVAKKASAKRTTKKKTAKKRVTRKAGAKKKQTKKKSARRRG